MKIRVEYTVSVEVDEDEAPKVEAALNVTAKQFDAVTANVEETDCEELEDEVTE